MKSKAPVKTVRLTTGQDDVSRKLNVHFCGSSCLVVAGAFSSVAGPTGIQLLVFFCSSVPVVLFNTPGISMCQSQNISFCRVLIFVSSYYLSVIYLFPVMIY